jgi:hypothetical protein
VTWSASGQFRVFGVAHAEVGDRGLRSFAGRHDLHTRAKDRSTSARDRGILFWPAPGQVAVHNLNIYIYQMMFWLGIARVHTERYLHSDHGAFSRGTKALGWALGRLLRDNPNFSYLGDTGAAPDEAGVPPGVICTQTSFGFGANARSAHSARRSARRCDRVRCCLGTVTAIFPWSTILTALRASGVQ